MTIRIDYDILSPQVKDLVKRGYSLRQIAKESQFSYGSIIKAYHWGEKPKKGQRKCVHCGKPIDNANYWYCSQCHSIVSRGLADPNNVYGDEHVKASDLQYMTPIPKKAK